MTCIYVIKVIKDIHLFGMIVVFLFVDTVILIIWSAVDPIRKDKKFLKDQVAQLVISSRQQFNLCRVDISCKNWQWMDSFFSFYSISLKQIRLIRENVLILAFLAGK